MPKETFWNSETAVENDGVSEPVLTVTWGEGTTGAYINGVHFDESGIARLAATLRRATGKDRLVTVTLDAQTGSFVEGMERARESVAALIDTLRSSGIQAEDIPDAMRPVLKLSRE